MEMGGGAVNEGAQLWGREGEGESVCTGSWASRPAPATSLVFREHRPEPCGSLLLVSYTSVWHCCCPNPGRYFCREIFSTDAGTFDFKQE